MLLKALLLSFALTEGSDLTTTKMAMNRGCVEANPAFGHQATYTRVVTQKVAMSVGLGALGVLLHKKGHPRQAWMVLGAGIAGGSLGTIWNIRLLPRCELSAERAVPIKEQGKTAGA